MSTYHLTIQSDIQQYRELQALLYLGYYLQERLTDGTIASYTPPKAYSYQSGKRVIAYSTGRAIGEGLHGRWFEFPVSNIIVLGGRVKAVDGRDLV